DKMDILLQQIQLPTDLIETHFKASSLDKLVIFKSKQTWHFHIQMDSLLPFRVYETFLTYLQQSFKAIAHVELTLYCKQNECKESEILAYWQYFVQTIPGLLPGHQQTLQTSPKIKDTAVTVTVATEAESVSLKRQIELPFQQFCKRVGLPNFSLHIEVKTEPAELEAFRKQKSLEDQHVVRNAQKLQQERQTQKEQVVEKQPFSIGYSIKDHPVKMETIVDEERKITVQGYVFLQEVRE